MILKICLGLKMWTSLCWNKLKNAIVYDLMNIWSPFVFYVPSAFARRNAIFLALIATSICICPFSLPYLILRYIRLVVIAPPSNLELYGSIMTLGGKAIGGRGGGSTQNFFRECFTSRLTLWVSFSPIGESADFTILCGVTLLRFLHKF